jgi:hypothetical protein
MTNVARCLVRVRQGCHALGLCRLILVIGSAGCTPSTPPAQEVTPPAPLPTTAPGTTVPEVGGGSGGHGASGSGGHGASGSGSPPASGAAPSGGATEKMCGGIAGLRCPAKQYCSYAPEARCGAGDMSGTCAPVPDACTLQLDEVCGCDGKTYGNACAATQAGVSVAMKGACAKPAADTSPEGSLCGTRGANKECAPGLYCAYRSACGATDAGGTCTKRPSMCTKIYAPVCGCDGKTYGSACSAAAAGVSVARNGECAKARGSGP